MYVFSKITFNTRKNSKKKNMAILVRKGSIICVETIRKIMLLFIEFKKRLSAGLGAFLYRK